MNQRFRGSCLALLLTFAALPATPQKKASPQATEAERNALYTEESIGGLRVGSPEKEVLKAIACKVQRGREQLEGATGDYVEDWKFPGCGVTLGMGSERKGGKKSVRSIAVTSPCAFQTKLGIRIGSTEAEVIQAYGRFRDEEWTKKGESFVAGSVYGGLIFTLTGGKVTKIFLGAAAE